MTTRTTTSKGDAPGEGAWAEDAAQTASGMLTKASEALQALPGELDVASDTMAGAMHSVSVTLSSAPDDSLLVGASIASGLAIGLLLGNAPRILAIGAVIAAVSMGATLAQRHPGRRAHLGRPVMS